MACGYTYIILLQKTTGDYGSAIIYSYGLDNIKFIRLNAGVWSTSADLITNSDFGYITKIFTPSAANTPYNIPDTVGLGEYIPVLVGYNTTNAFNYKISYSSTAGWKFFTDIVQEYTVKFYKYPG